MGRINQPDDAATIIRSSMGRLAALEGPTRISGAQVPNLPTPDDQNLAAWAFDVAHVSGVTALTLGVVYLTRIVLRTPRTVSAIAVYVGAGGSGLTANPRTGMTYAALLDGSGNTLDTTEDQSSVWSGTVNAPVVMELGSSHNLPASAYYAAWVANGGSSPPSFGRHATLSAALLNHGLTAAGGYRWCTYGTGQVTIPNPVPLASTTPGANAWWAALE